MKISLNKNIDQPPLGITNVASNLRHTCFDNWRTSLKLVAGALLTLVMVIGSQTYGFAQPVISIGTVSVNGDTNKTSAIEGDLVVFQVTASANVTSNLPVMVSISQTGDFIGTVPNDVYQTETAAGTFFPVVAASGGTITPNQVSVPMGEDSVLIGIQLEDDQIDEVNGSITVSLMGGAGYTVTSDTEGATQTMNVFDNETDPEFSIESRFTKVSDTDAFDIYVVANKASTQTFTINLLITSTPSTLISSQNQMATVSFAKNETRKKHTIRIESGIATSTTVGHPISISISPSTSYNVDAFKSSAIVNVVDGDSLPEVTISGSSPVGEGSPAEFTISLQATGGGSYTNTSAKTINLSTSQTGDFIFGTPFDSVIIPANSSSTVFAVATKSDGSSGSTPGNITTTLEAGEDYKLATTKTATVTVNDSGATQKPLLSITDGQLAMAGTNTMAQLMVTSKGNPGSSFSFDYIATNVSGNFLGSIADTKRTAMNLSFTETPASSGMYQAMLSFPIVADSNQNTGQLRVNLVRDNTSPVAYTVDAEASSATINVENATFLNPVITISRRSIEVEEGHDAIFVLQADRLPRPAANVKVRITQNGSFVSDISERTVPISSIYPILLEIATIGDANDESNGIVTATLEDDASYTIGTLNSASIGILDNDYTGLPTASIVAVSSEIDEGQNAKFDVTLTPAPSVDFTFNASVSVLGNFFNADVTGVFDVDVAITNGTGSYEIPTVLDTVLEANGRVTVEIGEDTHNPPRFSVGPNFQAFVDIKDNDTANLPVVSIARNNVRVWINEDAGTLGHNITATEAPAANTKVRVLVSQEGNFVNPLDLGITEYDLSTSVPISTRIANDSEDEANGSVTVTVLSDSNNPPRYSVGANARVTTLVSDDDLPINYQVYFDTALSDTGITIFKPFELTARSTAPVSEDLVISYYISPTCAPCINGGTNNLWSITIPKGQSSATVIHTVNQTIPSGSVRTSRYIFLMQTSSNYTSIQSQYSPTSFMEVAVKENNLTNAVDPVIKVETVVNQISAGQQTAGFRIIANNSPTNNLPVKYGIYRGESATNFLQAFPSELEIVTTNILADQTISTIQVPTNSNSNQVAKESIIQVFVLDGANYAVIADGNGESATVTISNDLNISISPKQTQITEGDVAEFMITTSKAITRSLLVNLSVSQTGNYLSANALSTNQILLDPTASNNRTDFALSLTTRSADADLTATGTINVEILTGANYFRGSNPVAELSVQDANTGTKPIITIARDNIEVEEGNDAVFSLKANETPGSEITVMVGITQTGDFVSNTANRPVKISNTQPVKLEIPTIADAFDESNGSVTAMILDATSPVSYTAGAIRTQTITIVDNDHIDLPTATIIARESEFEEGHNAVFNISAGGTPGHNFSINASVTVTGGFFESGVTGTFNTDIVVKNGTGTYELATVADAVNENDGSVVVTLHGDDQSPLRYSVGNKFKASTVIKDNDPTGVPVVTIARGISETSITESAGTLEHIITATAALATGTKVRVMFSQEGDFITIPPNGITEYTLSTSSPYNFRIMTTIPVDSMDEPDGSVTLSVLADSNATPRYSVGTEARVTTTITDDDEPTATGTPMVYFDTTLSDTGVSYLRPFKLTVRSMEPVSGDLTINFYVGRFHNAPPLSGVTNNLGSIMIPKGKSSATITYTFASSSNSSTPIHNDSGYIFLFQASTSYTSIQSQHSSDNVDNMRVAVKNRDPGTASLPVISVEAVENQVAAGERYIWFRVNANKAVNSSLPINYRVHRGLNESNFMEVFNSDIQTRSVNIPNGQSTAAFQVLSLSSSDQIIREFKSQVFLVDGAGYAVAGDGNGDSATVTVSNELSVSIVPKLERIDEGDVAEFIVTTSREINRPLTVNVDISQIGSYVAANSLSAKTIILDPTLAINSTQFNFTVPTRTADTSITESGTISYEILAGTNYYLGTNVVANITVIDARAEEQVFVASVSSVISSVVEGNSGIFEITLEAPVDTGINTISAEGIDVRFSIASSGGNFIYSDQNFSLASTQTINFTELGTKIYVVRTQIVTGNSTGSLVLTLLDDPANPDQYRQATAPQNSASISISDNGLAAPELSMSHGKIIETNEDDNVVIEGGMLHSVISINPATTYPLRIGVQTTETSTFLTTAERGAYTYIDTGIGDTSISVFTSTEDDRIDENDGMITLTLEPRDAYTIEGGKNSVSYSVKDNDNPPTVSFVDSIVQGSEGDGTMNFPVRLSAVSTKDVTVRYRVETFASNSVTSDDYSLGNTSITIQKGDMTGTIPVTIATNSPTNESTESFKLVIHSLTNAGFADSATTIYATGVILSDDGTGDPIISVNHPQVFEDSGEMLFQLTLSKPVTTNTSILWSTVDGTALAGSDYLRIDNKTEMFFVGETQKSFACSPLS